MLSTKREQLFSVVVAFCIGVAVWAEGRFPMVFFLSLPFH